MLCRSTGPPAILLPAGVPRFPGEQLSSADRGLDPAPSPQRPRILTPRPPPTWPRPLSFNKSLSRHLNLSPPACLSLSLRPAITDRSGHGPELSQRRSLAPRTDPGRPPGSGRSPGRTWTVAAGGLHCSPVAERPPSDPGSSAAEMSQPDERPHCHDSDSVSAGGGSRSSRCPSSSPSSAPACPPVPTGTFDQPLP